MPAFGDDGLFEIIRQRSGLLAQAKLRPVERGWGKFTANQRKVLPKKLAYSALLLYSFADRRTLSPFQWQSLRPARDLMQVERWLKESSFPSAVSSGELIRLLDAGKVGTFDSTIIDRDITPAGNTWLEVRIFWPDGSGPESIVT